MDNPKPRLIIVHRADAATVKANAVKFEWTLLMAIHDAKGDADIDAAIRALGRYLDPGLKLVAPETLPDPAGECALWE